MAYYACGSNSCLDSIREDIAEILNLQELKLLHERALMDGDKTVPQLESLQRAHHTVSLRLIELLDKYNIK